MMMSTQQILETLTNHRGHSFEYNFHCLLDVFTLNFRTFAMKACYITQNYKVFLLFLSLNIPRTPHLSELIFWNYINDVKHDNK